VAERRERCWEVGEGEFADDAAVAGEVDDGGGVEVAGETGAWVRGEGERPAGGWEVVWEEEAEFCGLAVCGGEGALADVGAMLVEACESFPDVVAGVFGGGGGAEEERLECLRVVGGACGDEESGAVGAKQRQFEHGAWRFGRSGLHGGDVLGPWPAGDGVISEEDPCHAAVAP